MNQTTIPPELKSNILDLNEGILVLNISEAANMTSLDTMGLVLDSSTDTNSIYLLTQESITYDGNAKSFNVIVLPDNLNAIKTDFNVITELNNTFLVINTYNIFGRKYCEWYCYIFIDVGGTH